MPPSPFVIQWAERIRLELPVPPCALDVAMGRGRHAVALARSGYRVFGVDIRLDALQDARTHAAIHAWCADLNIYPLPRARFDLVVVARYLQRDLFDNLGRAVTPGGALLYETFTTGQRALGTGPTSPDHLLEPGELEARVRDLDAFKVVFAEEVATPEALARVVARKRA
jgi:tellurite methyltransferase